MRGGWQTPPLGAPTLPLLLLALLPPANHHLEVLYTLGPDSTVVVGLGQLGCLLELAASGILLLAKAQSQPHTGEKDTPDLFSEFMIGIQE